MLNFNHLYYFHVAATQGSLSAAAEKLGIKQSTVSEQLRALERSLHATLFERTSTGLRLTAAGQIAYEHTTTMFRSADRLLQAITGKEDVPKTLRVGVSGAVARATSTDFLMPLFALPQCTPTITTGETVDMLRELRANELDLLLCEIEPTDVTGTGLQRAVIEHIPLVAITGPTTDPGPGWKDAGLIQYRKGSTFYSEVNEYLALNHLEPVIVGEADDPFLLVEAASRGEYVVVVPASAARDALTAGRIRVLAQIESVHAAVHAIYQDGTSAELARRAIESLIEASKRA